MDRTERLERSFMESPDWEEPLTATPVVIPHPQNPMPDDETARRQVMTEICRDPELRWLVEFRLGPDEARERYPEAYGIFE